MWRKVERTKGKDKWMWSRERRQAEVRRRTGGQAHFLTAGKLESVDYMLFSSLVFVYTEVSDV